MYILIGTAVLLLDFITKMLVKANMNIGEKISLIDGVFSLTYIRNKGMAWGLLQNQRWIFIIGTVIRNDFSLVILDCILQRIRINSIARIDHHFSYIRYAIKSGDACVEHCGKRLLKRANIAANYSH